MDDKLKKASIYSGVAIGSLIGAPVQLCGKLAKNKTIEDLGEDIMDSSIATGAIVGDVLSGTSNLVGGFRKKNTTNLKKGKHQLKRAGKKALGNFEENLEYTLWQGDRIISGVKEKDKMKVGKGLKNLGKMMIIGAITVGAVKINEESKASVVSTKPKSNVQKKTGDDCDLDRKLTREQEEVPMEFYEEVLDGDKIHIPLDYTEQESFRNPSKEEIEKSIRF